jgi:hypothetical protein
MRIDKARHVAGQSGKMAHFCGFARTAGWFALVYVNAPSKDSSTEINI